jgi:hypothetical protein
VKKSRGLLPGGTLARAAFDPKFQARADCAGTVSVVFEKPFRKPFKSIRLHVGHPGMVFGVGLC